MSPPIHKDWLLAAALTGAALPPAIGQTASAAPQRLAGVVTTVTQGASVTTTQVQIESASGQKLSTGPNQVMHVLFSDQSALTVGPNSVLVIAEYRYDTQAKDGNLLVELTTGLLRVVGGLLSKKKETLVRTSTATIGIRGGISVVDSNSNGTSSVFLFGQSMRVTGSNGQNRSVNRPGFGVVAGDNGLSEPQRVEAVQINSQLRQLDGNGPNLPPTGFAGNTDGPGEFNSVRLNSLAIDRLSTLSSPEVNVNRTPSQTLREVLGTSQVQVQS